MLIQDLDGFWVRGGNTFVLRVAYQKSVFYEILVDDLLPLSNFVYGGFSAGCCVLQKSLKGIDFVDDPNIVKEVYGPNENVIWDGVGLLDYAFVPHFESLDHTETEDTNMEIKYY